MYHPWRAFRRLHEWTLHLAKLPTGTWAETHWPSLTVTIDSRLLQAERRSAIAHELVHIERGPVPTDPVLAAREEAAVEQETARRLIPLDRLVDALAWAHNIEEAADELWVDVETLRVRLDHLHPSEKHHLRERLCDDHPTDRA